MRLNSVFIRFYKSFNVDDKRQTDSRVIKKPWEIIKADDTEMWYPYIQVPIDKKITAIVGANESGKSHLLSAIEKAITGRDYEGNPISSRDFCRYSERFLVTSDKSRLPDFGTEWDDVTPSESDFIKSMSDISESRSFNKFLLFRTSTNTLNIYLPEEEGKYSFHQVNPQNVDKFIKILPGTRRLKNNIALPSSIPIQKLVEKVQGKTECTRYEIISANQRQKLRKLLDELYNNPEMLNQPTNVYSSNEQLKSNRVIQEIMNVMAAENNQENQAEEVNLTYNLLCKIAKIKDWIFMDLANSMEANDIGYTQALVDKINRQLTANLNFPNYWAQDSKFRLILSTKDHNIEFTIVDRTGTKYSFAERSSGLKYFLSYFIQHRSYEPPNNVPEILLMDEPDAFLSSRAQQDLLKIFEEVANSEDGKPASQVVYVTHSPFLIDKNHAQRIRVLDKGSDYIGTRVVKSVSKNHYEPLRSAFGAFVAETVYISHCNLMVEGPVDQVLLAGASTYLRTFGIASKRESLDLNEITIVPAEGATNIPYLTYLARGRDSEQPAVIVLLDSDQKGYEAKIELTKKGYGPRKKPPLKEEFVLQVGDLSKLGLYFPEKLTSPEVEDLIPVAISVKAAQKFAADVLAIRKRDIADITEDFVQQRIELGETMYDAVNACVKQCSKEPYYLDKVGFARSVIEVINLLKKDDKREEKYTTALEKFEFNFKTLFRELDRKKSLAELERTRDKASEKVKGIEESFLSNHPNSAKREDAVEFLEKLEALLLLDDSFNANEIKKGISNIRSEYNLYTNLGENIENYEKFKLDVKQLKNLGDLASQEIEEPNQFIREENLNSASSENTDLKEPSLALSDSDNQGSDLSPKPKNTSHRRAKTSKSNYKDNANT